MTETNRIHDKLGLPVVDQEEHEELTQALTFLADSDSFDATVLADAATDSSGVNNVNNIYYVNFDPKTQSQTPQQTGQLAALQKNISLNTQFMEIKANEVVNQKIASRQLKDEQTSRANYKAKVISWLTQNSPWTASFAVQNNHKEFVVEKDSFHRTLVTTFTQGLPLPDNIGAQLEGVLTNIKSTINSFSTPQESLLFYISLTVYQKDDMIQVWQPCSRCIYFKVDRSLSNYTQTKGSGNSSGNNAVVTIEYMQADGQFNEKMFEKTAKPSIEQIVASKPGTSVVGEVNVSI
ncbi:Nn.00g102320.m01.CDS01 [Neocucurbitaria sp. VM-36]